MNAGASHKVWQLLYFLTCKPVGLQEYNSILFEYDLPSFPNDYPTADAHREVAQAQAVALAAKYLRQPDNKKLDYEKLSSPFPFRSNWDHLLEQFVGAQHLRVCYDDLQQVLVLPHAKGAVLDRGYLHEARPEDTAQFQQQQARGDRVHSVPYAGQKLVGYVTTGAFSQRENSSKGIATVLKYYFAALQKGPVFCLYRKTTSDQVYLVRLTDLARRR